MKKRLILLMSLTALLYGCVQSIDPEGNPVPEPEKPYQAEIPGRLVTAYVTYYGTAIPDPKYVTNICYAFAELYVTNGVYHGFKLQGKEERFKSIVDLKKQYPNLKISLSFTHTVSNSDNVQGGGFSAMASTEVSRKQFAEDCLEFVKKWGIDGIDIDWEFPGISWSGHACDPKIDVENHVLLMKQLRETLGPDYLLSYAGYCMDKKATAGGYKYIDVKAVDPYVDFVNIMTYDLDEAPHHHSALKAPNAYWDCDRAVRAYLDAKIPANKLLLGVPFYGRVSFSSSPSAINYRNILMLGSGYEIDNWDNAASVPYVTRQGRFYCGYDNARSIEIKARWILSLGMKGIMYWDYDGDDSKGTLRKAVWQSVMTP